MIVMDAGGIGLFQCIGNTATIFIIGGKIDFTKTTGRIDDRRGAHSQ